MREGLKKLHVVVFGVFLLGLVLRVYGITNQPPISDEVAAAYAAENYIRHGIFGQIMWYHPQLRNILIYVVSHLSGGYDAWGLKGASIITGSLTVLVLGYLAYFMTKSVLVAFLSAFFLAIDPLHISLSREAVQAAMTPFFIILGVYFSLIAIKKEKQYMHYFAGLFFGLATSSKWHGLFPWAVMGVLSFFLLIRSEDRSRFDNWLILINSYLILPFVIYFATYIPWLLKGHGIKEFLEFQAFLIKRQLYHTGPAYAEVFLSHKAWKWFVLPTAWVDFVFLNGRPYLNIAMGNYLVWVLTIPSLIFLVNYLRNNKKFEMTVLILNFLCSYLPLVFTSRGIWVFSAPAVIPFAFIMIAWMINEMLQKGKIKKGTIVVYICLISLVSALMYPMATFKAYEYSYLKPLVQLYNPHGQR